MENLVRDKRMALGMTQDELSEMLNVYRQTIISKQVRRNYQVLSKEIL